MWWREQPRKNKLPTTLKKNYWTSSEHFTSITYIFHFWVGSQSEGITFTIQFFQVQLDWSCQNLSLLIDYLFWICFRQLGKWLSLVLCTDAWLSLCASLLVFCSTFKLIVFGMLNENFFVTCKVKMWRKLEIAAASFSSSLSLFSSKHAHKCIHRNNWTWWAKSVQAQMQVGCHWILLFVLLLANSSSSSFIPRNRVFYMFSFTSLSCK